MRFLKWVRKYCFCCCCSSVRSRQKEERREKGSTGFFVITVEEAEKECVPCQSTEQETQEPEQDSDVSSCQETPRESKEEENEASEENIAENEGEIKTSEETLETCAEGPSDTEARKDPADEWNDSLHLQTSVESTEQTSVNVIAEEEEKEDVKVNTARKQRIWQEIELISVSSGDFDFPEEGDMEPKEKAKDIEILSVTSEDLETPAAVDLPEKTSDTELGLNRKEPKNVLRIRCILEERREFLISMEKRITHLAEGIEKLRLNTI